MRRATLAPSATTSASTTTRRPSPAPSRWRAAPAGGTANDFVVRWSNPPGQVAPIARARYRLCDAGACTDGEPGRQQPRFAAASGSRRGRVCAASVARGCRGQPRSRPGERSGAPALRRRGAGRHLRGIRPANPLTVVAAVADRGAGVVAGARSRRGRIGRAGLAGPRRQPGRRVPGGACSTTPPFRTASMRCARTCATAPATSGPATGAATGRRCGARFRCAQRRSWCWRSGGVAPAGRAAQALRVRRSGPRERPPHPRRAPCGRSSGSGSPDRRAGGGAQRRRFRAGRDGRHGLRRALLTASGGGPSRTVRFRYDGTRVIRPAAADLRILARAGSSIAVDRRFALEWRRR